MNVTSCAQTIMLHAALHWPEQADVSLWPMALTYATYLWNIMPRPETELLPLEIFAQSKQLTPLIHHMHVWGCPVYILDPVLQDGKKLPKWRARSCRGIFLGHSSHYATTIGNILNLKTQHISPQFHVIYDDWFMTMYSTGDVDIEQWR